jgi:signal transduction histidine kinase
LVAIDIDVNVDPAFSIQDRTRELNIFRIVQEALTNAIKHSKAKHIEISSAKKIDSQGTSVLSLEVRDDGTGLPEHIQGEGLGLRIMQNRAAMADAKLSLESDDEGTTVQIVFKE